MCMKKHLFFLLMVSVFQACTIMCNAQIIVTYAGNG